MLLKSQLVLLIYKRAVNPAGYILNRSLKGPNWPEKPVSRFLIVLERASQPVFKKGPGKGQSQPVVKNFSEWTTLVLERAELARRARQQVSISPIY